MTNTAEPLPLATASRTKRPVVFVGIMLATFMTAMEATIIATAMPRIVGELSGFEYYTWFSRPICWPSAR